MVPLFGNGGECCAWKIKEEVLMEAGCLGWLNHTCSEKAAQWYYYFCNQQ